VTDTPHDRGWVSKILFPAGSPFLAVIVLTGLTTLSAQAQTFTVLHTFSGPDGASPAADLILDSAANVYGTSTGGGAFGFGTVFEVDRTGKETVLYSFKGGQDGGNPRATLAKDSSGNLYGTTYYAGNLNLCPDAVNPGCGVVFKLDKHGHETVLHTFTARADGAYPAGRLVLDAAGNLYGTTRMGGDSSCTEFPGGCGVVFKVAANGHFSVLYAFAHGGQDGRYPWSGLMQDAQGNLYGTTPESGKGICCGTVFKVTKDGHETVLHKFTGAHAGLHDGWDSRAGLVLDTKGNLFGTTSRGGTFDYGTVFKVDKNGKESVLITFADRRAGGLPYSDLVLDANSNLYGTAAMGGRYGSGNVFKTNETGKEIVLHQFTGAADGAIPLAGLVQDTHGNFYGVTFQGGNLAGCMTAGCGTVFRLTP